MTEVVVLLDERGNAVGTMPKAAVHHGSTPRHLAFSAYFFDPDGALLVTRRALGKATFPGLWTNSVCGHPAPGEPLPQAVARRARDELGTQPVSLRLVLPLFTYRAEMDGVVEDEWCPVYAGELADRTLAPLPDEVADTEWVPWPEFAGDVLAGRREVSVWCREQVRALSRLGPEPAAWPQGDGALLPPAART
ncbi:isopentenyl-diphosphate Delta-isomerase [Pedococcus sp. NPDC057267]|uniref:isopentenyl-diphosphate Delta-isomerase n=1 Tax=Pedococcus sp. NPDC057267 TaxID=3346077 RepID=UPI00363D326F